MVREPLLRRIAAQVLGEEKSRIVWKRIDIVGDIAIIRAPPNAIELEELKLIGEELIKRLPYIRSVWLASGPVDGPYRVRTSFTHLAGEERLETEYKEHGCRFRVDLSRVFITPRLSYEHLRIARLVKPGETVINMFAGAGLFSIIIACKSQPRIVYSIDINPYAVELIRVNAQINRVADKVRALHGDAREIVESSLRGVADRVLMPLPELAIEYLPAAVDAIRSRGFIHVYLHVKADKQGDPREKSIQLVAGALAGLESVKRFRFTGARKVRSVGPRLVQTVVDVEVEK